MAWSRSLGSPRVRDVDHEPGAATRTLEGEHAERQPDADVLHLR
jgi:hypothetical protein